MEETAKKTSEKGTMSTEDTEAVETNKEISEHRQRELLREIADRK